MYIYMFVYHDFIKQSQSTVCIWLFPTLTLMLSLFVQPELPSYSQTMSL